MALSSQGGNRAGSGGQRRASPSAPMLQSSAARGISPSPPRSPALSLSPHLTPPEHSPPPTAPIGLGRGRDRSAWTVPWSTQSQEGVSSTIQRGRLGMSFPPQRTLNPSHTSGNDEEDNEEENDEESDEEEGGRVSQYRNLGLRHDFNWEMKYGGSGGETLIIKILEEFKTYIETTRESFEDAPTFRKFVGQFYRSSPSLAAKVEEKKLRDKFRFKFRAMRTSRRLFLSNRNLQNRAHRLVEEITRDGTGGLEQEEENNAQPGVLRSSQSLSSQQRGRDVRNHSRNVSFQANNGLPSNERERERNEQEIIERATGERNGTRPRSTFGRTAQVLDSIDERVQRWSAGHPAPTLTPQDLRDRIQQARERDQEREENAQFQRNVMIGLMNTNAILLGKKSCGAHTIVLRVPHDPELASQEPAIAVKLDSLTT